MKSRLIKRQVRIKDDTKRLDEESREFAGQEGTIVSARRDLGVAFYLVAFDNGREGEFYRREFAVLDENIRSWLRPYNPRETSNG